MNSYGRALTIFARLIMFGAALNADAQQPAVVARTGNLDSAQLAVLRDIIGVHATQQWAQDNKPLCVDPDVAVYPDSSPVARASNAVERWSNESLAAILQIPHVALDSSVAAVPRAAPKCARTQAISRHAYGRPRLFGDSGAVVFIESHFDGHAFPDSQIFDYQLQHRAGKWRVPHWLAYRESVRTYVNGEGCYRFTHAPFVYGIRIDTVLVRADTARLNKSSPRSPTELHHLYPLGMQIGLASNTNWIGEPAIPRWSAKNETVSFEWYAGFGTMITVNVRLMGDSLSGRMYYETDAVVPDPPSVVVTGKRVACPPL